MNNPVLKRNWQSSTFDTQPCDKIPSPIMEEMAGLESQISEAGKALGELESRLEMVLNPREPEPCKDEKPEGHGLLGCAVRQNREMRTLIGKVESMISRLTL